MIDSLLRASFVLISLSRVVLGFIFGFVFVGFFFVGLILLIFFP